MTTTADQTTNHAQFTAEEYADRGATAEQAERWAEDQTCTVKDCKLCWPHCSGKISNAVKCDHETCAFREITAAELGVRFRFTIQASELGAALRNVAPFACTDDTLPVLTGVQLTVAADTIPGVPGSAAQPARREITLLSTDRYTIARQTLTIDASDVTGAGSVVLPKELVKSLAAKWRARNWELVSITAGDDDTITARDFDGNTSAARALPGDQFPRAGKMLDDFQPATDANDVGSMPSIAFNSKYVARFAKIGNGQETVKFTLAADDARSDGYETKRYARPVRWECGDASGLICATKLAQ